MKRTTLKLLFVLTAWSMVYPVLAAGNPPPPPTGHPNEPVSEPTFRTLDMNADGYLSRAEVRRETNLGRLFDQLDTNRDGRLSREEMRGLTTIEGPGDAAYRRAREAK